MFKGLLVEKDDAGYRTSLKTLDEAQLPEGDVLVKVTHSTLNYKDALAITGKGKIVRSFPMVPGIDFAGIVEESAHPAWKQGDKVILNGWEIGETRWGGLAEKALVRGEWLVRLPEKFTLAQSMAIGTAGYTAMLCVLALERQRVTPDKGEIVVTGAAGGVGSIAVAVLARLGYRVVASTGRPEEADYLKSLGAAEIIDRNTLNQPGKPLLSERWAGAVDTVGSYTLANVCASTKFYGVVTACGLAQGMDFPSTVAPFILRGITLVGINSVFCALRERDDAWHRLAKDLDIAKLDDMTSTIPLDAAIAKADDVLAGKVRGRTVVDIGG